MNRKSMNKKNAKNQGWKIAGMGFAVLFLTIFLSGCDQSKTISRSDFLLDTFVSITLFGETDERLLDKPFARIAELNSSLTAFETESDLGLIKENAGIKPVSVSADTYKIIAKSLAYSRDSGGYFDVTIAPLVDLWGIHSPETKNAPASEAINAAKEKTDYRKIVLNPADQSVYLTEAGMAVNLGAIAKGYIADEAMAVLKQEGVEHALINLGGNVLVMGGKADNSDFGVGVEDPRNPGNGYLGVLSLKDGSVVTSGDYQRYFVDAAGKKYHHILDPFSGYPSDSGLIQVTVVAKASVDADSLSTILFLVGLDEGLKKVEALPDVEAIFITNENKIVVTNGLNDAFVFDEENYGDTYTLAIR
ncbi:FAD:protein FMN transferase [uncultured Acetobacterium sp.]|uniref:FAD:protein FMN transferase n=1 Tax=uncultured Acetobacterium sp. TaxID=217139 RepID=UPI0025F91E37|nr:FAD:protein FMN transferase [uncultured Acetobacterium sp.]